MATENIASLSIQFAVNEGGTGATTLADHAVLVGSGAGAITAIAVGATGNLLVGSTGADPFFDNSSTGDFTFTSSTASVNRVLTVSNTDNTGAATSQATLQLTVGGANVGDPKVTHTVTGATSFTTGIDNNDSDAYKISASTALGTTDVLTIDTDGHVRKPLNPAFLALKTTHSNNVTGAGTEYAYVCNSAIFNMGSDYNTGTGQFTAPVSGTYFFVAFVYMTGCTNTTREEIKVFTSNRTYNLFRYRPSAFTFDRPSTVSCYADMDAGDIAYPTTTLSGLGGNTANVFGLGTDAISSFAGFLVC